MPASTTLRAGSALLLSALVGAMMLVLAAPAEASCAGNPQPSPYAFSGVVERTDLGERIAYVRTDDGRDVVVRGTSATVGSGFTTVDRSYLTGHRYVFHPVNGASPYEDNVCTLTYDLGPEPAEAARAVPETELTDGSDISTRPTSLLLGAAAGVVLLATGVVLVRRTRTNSPDDDPVTDAEA